MRLQRLADLKKPARREMPLAALPTAVPITPFALDKAQTINLLVRRIHGRSYEWYGFTLAWRQQPEVIVDIGLPVNDKNQDQYVSLTAEQIAAFREGLPEAMLINGWLHSHGDLALQHFSAVDAANQATVLDYVTAQLRLPVAKVEVAIQDLVCLQEGRWTAEDLRPGSVTLITDVPVGRAQLWETEYGGFCYAIVIGDDGWHEQEIHYKKRGILSGRTFVSHLTADLTIVADGRHMTASEREELAEAVRTRLSPVSYVPARLEGL
ncbi:MAG: hypothetical protein ACUVRZ_03560 [Desulfobacca sp.]|uniref:hypothetical protein n=1 Tax=Desulfobacca sp. TaxID=2067990 RepID=UPI004049C730